MDFVNPASISRRIYTIKRIQEHLDSHLNNDDNVQPKEEITNHDLSISLLKGPNMARGGGE